MIIYLKLLCPCAWCDELSTDLYNGYFYKEYNENDKLFDLPIKFPYVVYKEWHDSLPSPLRTEPVNVLSVAQISGTNFISNTKTKQKQTSEKNSYNNIVYHSTSEVRCPKCGSTQIQMVTRKWRPLTGFMTNKVDRVCMKCKHRF